MNFKVQRASISDATAISYLVTELLSEIMEATGDPSFQVDFISMEERCKEWFIQDRYVAFVASLEHSSEPIGVLTLYESYALYAGGVFGTIPEFYVGPLYRSQGVGHLLLNSGTQYARDKGWGRLEVTTPSLPTFDRTVNFYAQEGFINSGGRKMKRLLR